MHKCSPTIACHGSVPTESAERIYTWHARLIIPQRIIFTTKTRSEIYPKPPSQLKTPLNRTRRGALRGATYLEKFGLAPCRNDARAEGDVLAALQSIAGNQRGISLHQFRAIPFPGDKAHGVTTSTKRFQRCISLYTFDWMAGNRALRHVDFL